MRRFSLLLVSLVLAFTAGCGGSSGSGSGSNSGSGTAAGPSTSASTPAGTASTAPAGCASAGTKHFAKTKFLLHAGLAYGAFHRYLLKPYQAGAFKTGAPGRVKALAKAGASALFIAHELKLARESAAADPNLCRLTGALDRATALLPALAARFKSGQFNPSDLTGVNGLLGRIGDLSKSAGAPITER